MQDMRQEGGEWGMEEERLLTVEEVLFLVNLMYLPKKECGFLKPLKTYEGRTVGDLIREARDRPKEPPLCEYGMCMTEHDWDELFETIHKNEMVMQVEITSVRCDRLGTSSKAEESSRTSNKMEQRTTVSGDVGDDDEGLSALFVNHRTGEAVVAFRGTGKGEWKDNFQGGGSTDENDRVSTRRQIRALEWYQSLKLDSWFVTVTGHSKGGNKAKYITILDDSVDRCLSFDGQGFSDEFMDWYRVRIRLREKVIENHNVENDYVNFLLNSVGRTVWYRGRNYKKGEFLKNHCPIAFFEFSNGGTCLMRKSEDGQVKALRQVDLFLTFFLGSLSKREKYDLLDLLGTLAQKYAEGAPKETFLVSLLDEKNRDGAVKLAQYAFSYRKEHSEFSEAIDWLFDQAGMDGLIWAVRTVQAMFFGQLRDR